MSLAPLNRGKENTTKRGSSLPSLIVELPALLFLALAFGFGEAFAPPPANNDCRGSASMAGGICMSSGRASKRVVVVGAGAAGLATAKEMRVRGHEVVVLEQASEIGGVWSYEPEVEDDPMSVSSKVPPPPPRLLHGDSALTFVPKRARNPFGSACLCLPLFSKTAALTPPPAAEARAQLNVQVAAHQPPSRGYEFFRLSLWLVLFRASLPLP